jgi:hypothetical protein
MHTIRKLLDTHDIGLFFFAGHGIQFEFPGPLRDDCTGNCQYLGIDRAIAVGSSRYSIGALLRGGRSPNRTRRFRLSGEVHPNPFFQQA